MEILWREKESENGDAFEDREVKRNLIHPFVCLPSPPFGEQNWAVGMNHESLHSAWFVAWKSNGERNNERVID